MSMFIRAIIIILLALLQIQKAQDLHNGILSAETA